VETENTNLKSMIQTGNIQNDQHVAKIKELEQIQLDLNAQIVELEGKLRAGESVRRKLHNTIQVYWLTQELKGNIRVFCRVRPLLSSEASSPGKEMPHLIFPEAEDSTIELVQSSVFKITRKTLLEAKLSPRTFRFRSTRSLNQTHHRNSCLRKYRSWCNPH
jgi:hypothetical protein